MIGQRESERAKEREKEREREREESLVSSCLLLRACGPPRPCSSSRACCLRMVARAHTMALTNMVAYFKKGQLGRRYMRRRRRTERLDDNYSLGCTFWSNYFSVLPAPRPQQGVNVKATNTNISSELVTEVESL
jgi:hypothetical protein